MKNSISEQSFYIESDEDDQEKQIVNNDHNEDGSDSDSSNYSNDDNDEQRSKSIITSWPQSYRLGHSPICRWKFFLSVYGYLNFGSDI